MSARAIPNCLERIVIAAWCSRAGPTVTYFGHPHTRRRLWHRAPWPKSPSHRPVRRSETVHARRRRGVSLASERACNVNVWPRVGSRSAFLQLWQMTLLLLKVAPSMTLGRHGQSNGLCPVIPERGRLRRPGALPVDTEALSNQDICHGFLNAEPIVDLKRVTGHSEAAHHS